MDLHTLKPFAGSRHTIKRIGRGLGSGHGTYSTRGMKGQNSRGGGKAGQKRRGMRQIMLRIPKLSGFRSIHPKAYVANLDGIEKLFAADEMVTPQTLHQKKLISLKTGENSPLVKILGRGTITKKIIVQGCDVSASARTKIEQVKGEIR